MCGQRARPYSQPSTYLICFLFVLHQSENNSWDTANLKFDLEKSKIKVMGEVKGQGHIVHPVCNRCTSFSFHINRTNHSWDMSNRVFDLEKTHPKFSKKIWQKQVSNRIPPKCNQVISMTRGIKLYSDWLRGSYFILQTSKFLFINATAGTLSQGHRKVIQYIFPDPYFLCPKYLRFSSNHFKVISKSHCGGGGGRHKLKT